MSKKELDFLRVNDSVEIDGIFRSQNKSGSEFMGNMIF
jgi:hypothetical protein